MQQIDRNREAGNVSGVDLLINEKGFSLIGALIGLAIFVVGILAVFSMQSSSMSSAGKSMKYTQANGWAQDAIESLISDLYDDPALEPPYGVGAEIDPLEPVDYEDNSLPGGFIHVVTEGPYTIKWVVFTSDHNGKSLNDFATIKDDEMFEGLDKNQNLRDIPVNTKVISLQVSHPQGQKSHLVYLKANV
jgi:hypothetical protein